MRRRAFLAWAAVVVAALQGSCTRAPTQAPPMVAGARVVALSPAVASIMQDLGLGATIVGRHGSDAWSDQSLPVCGDQVAGIDYEMLLRVAPTHVFLQAAETPPRLVETARARGILVENFSILSLDEIRHASRRLAAWNGAAGPLPQNPPRAPIEDRMDAAWTTRPSIHRDRIGRVLLLASVDPAGALGPGSWHDDLLRRLGATPAISEGSAYITLDVEDVLRLAPDAIIIFLPRGPRDGPRPDVDVSALLGRLGTLNIPAVIHKRLALVDDPMGHLPSTAMIRVADEMARVLERWSE